MHKWKISDNCKKRCLKILITCYFVQRFPQFSNRVRANPCCKSTTLYGDYLNSQTMLERLSVVKVLCSMLYEMYCISFSIEKLKNWPKFDIFTLYKQRKFFAGHPSIGVCLLSSAKQRAQIYLESSMKRIRLSENHWAVCEPVNIVPV